MRIDVCVLKMPKIAIPLNDTKIKSLKPKAKRYLIADGGGLVLEVMTSGAKVWRYRYSLHGKQQPLITIGDYPAVGVRTFRTVDPLISSGNADDLVWRSKSRPSQ
jgi:hypothetical protein